MSKVALARPDHPPTHVAESHPEEVSAGRAQDPALSPGQGAGRNTRARGCRGPGNHIGRLQEVHTQKRDWLAPDRGHPLMRYPPSYAAPQKWRGGGVISETKI